MSEVRNRRRTSRGGRAVWVAFSAAIVIIAGCEAIVSDSVPSFACSGNDASCPVGKVCVPATGTCIAATASCLVTPCASNLECDSNSLECVNPATVVDGSFIVHDTGTIDSSDSAVTDTDSSQPTTDSSPPTPGALGTKCGVGTDCQSGLCAGAAELGDTYFRDVGPVCIEPCCTSEACGTGFVCAGTGTGGNYCLSASLLTLTIGAGKGGTSCTTPSNCRSGQCIGSVCADTCCTDTDCSGAARCRLTQVQTGHETYACGTGGTKTIGATCGTNADCESGACYGSGTMTCRPACCGQTSSNAENYGACTYLSAGSDLLTAGLYPAMAAPAGAAVGAQCTLQSDCKSDLCDTTNGVCSDVCCVDSDCAGYAGAGFTKCRPVELASGVGTTINPLICVKAP